MATTDFVVKNGLVVTEEAQILSTTDATSATDTAAAVYTAGGVAIAKKAFIGGTMAVTGDVTLTGDLTVNGGDITTTASTFNLVNATATTVNFAGAATTLEIGAATGTTNINNNLDVDGDINIDGGDLTASTGNFNLLDANVTALNFARAATSLTIGATTGTTTVRNASVTLNGTTLNINGANPSIASSNTGTASIFNANITSINFGHAAAISMGSTTLNTTVRGNLLVNGNTTLGDASSDLVTFNANTASVPNSLTFTIDDAIANNVSYPVAIRHTTSGTAANNIGVGLQFVTETAGGVNRTGVAIESIASSAVNGSENFNFVVDTMTSGGTAAQALLVNNNTMTVGAASTAATINTQLSSALTVTAGASGVTSNGNTVTIQGGAGGLTSGAGGAVSVFGGDASTNGIGGIATFRAGNATGTNIIGANTIIDAGQGTGTGRSGQIIFRTGPGGSSGAARNPLTTVLILTEGGIEIPGNLLIGGNFTVDGLVTTVNSTTLTVDDKNIELGSVVAKSSLQATLATGTAVVTLTAGDTKSLIPGMALTVNVGPGAFGAGAVIATVNSLTQFTASVNHAVAGTATFTAGGVSEFTADGGGITVKGTTDKTFNWIRSTGHWTANTNISAPALVSTTATGTAPLTVASTTKVDNLNADLLDGFNSATASTVSTVAVRDASGDINVRLVRSEFANQATISGAMAFRVNNSTDNYIRFVSDTPAIRTFLSVPTRTGGDASGTWAISITGNAATATSLANSRTIAMTGDVSYTSGAFDGSGNVTGTATLATVNSNVGTFNNVTVNGKGLVTAASNVTYLTAEADTLATVTGRGSSTATASTFSGGLTASGATAITLGHATANVITTSASGSSLTLRTANLAIGGSVNITAGNSSNANQPGGGLFLAAGTGGAGGNGGTIDITSGSSGTTSGTTGSVTIQSSNITNGGNGNTGVVTINTGSSQLGASGALTISTGNGTSGVGILTIRGGTGAATTATAGGAISVIGGTGGSSNGTGGAITITGGTGGATNGAGGAVAINGGVRSGSGVEGTINIGVTTAGAVNIGKTGINTTINAGVRLPGVGTSGLVRLGASGQLSADTNTYLTAEADTLATVTGRGASTNTAVTLAGGITTNATNTRDKIRVWNDSTYTIGMQNSITFGAVNNDYAMTFQMSNTDARGFWWGDSSHTTAQGAMALSTNGKLTVAHSVRIGFGEADLVVPGATHRLEVNGSFAATSKSFLIDHPTKSGQKLQYGSLEGPELGVYVRGKLADADVIELPDYWTGLVHADSITVNLTAAAAGQQLYVERIENNCVYIINETGKPVNCFYTVYGERKDVDKLAVEIE